MPIIGTLPNNIQNGQAVDANPVMADFNFIVNQVNANANPSGTLTAPSGTRAVFQQASAPTGWTVDASATFADAAMRFNNSGFTTGGVTAWSGWNAGNTINLNAFTLSVAQLPAHNHTDAGHIHTDAGHTHRPGDLHNFYTDGTSATITGPGALNLSTSSGTNVGNANIQTGFANIQNTGSGASITPNFTTPQVKFADCIVGIKS
jgi:hypothetical protein